MSKKKDFFAAHAPPNGTVRVIRPGAPSFFAAHSSFPFAEANEDYPDYAFYSLGNRYWCVRVGDLEIPWGINVELENGNRLWANGIIRIKRLNHKAHLDGKGFTYTKEKNGVFYLYEKVFRETHFCGFAIHLRDEFLPILTEIAQTAQDVPTFKKALQAFPTHADAIAVLDKDLIFSENSPVRLDCVGIEKKNK